MFEIGSRNTFISIHPEFGCAYFRVLGYGINVGLTKRHTVRFSERYGYRKVHYIGKICFWFLKP